ncbi:ABC transporter ATP-binding protein [Metamycoplasma hyosynoviae]|uniref:ABC transporter ATP-binding protein n=1 Tax=Metamycoplasma hyosynoviae TaxID=29559 RepID=UPI0023596417|nr:ABC transporter ATP-binding protein [Metamycoplasma hyosynoviae]MDC8914186.1 ABC transporter ATP-binding protein [Metamycoplasma hyosynoviae]MDC8915650.1 ABC transporter ATP-binding protein [Metamycoplasma hyosynoviae]MDC8917651.1 ABC transporter ATP-binding protein [Metamycoplasma hyosynoviae]MDC8918541.1 ABC transporter ATP-binding protein [Metamycoplasma hyosynoviae]MDC8921502.1 ABC transporter ATP-binding protein [Metamycoplasma hyosynoviae]
MEENKEKKTKKVASKLATKAKTTSVKKTAKTTKTSKTKKPTETTAIVNNEPINAENTPKQEVGNIFTKNLLENFSSTTSKAAAKKEQIETSKKLEVEHETTQSQESQEPQIPEVQKEPLYDYNVSIDDSGYSKIFKKSLEFKVKPEPESVKQMTGLPTPSFWTVLKKSFINAGKQIKYFFTEVLPTLFKKNKVKKDFFNFNEYIQKADEEYIFNKWRKVVAEVKDIYLSFANPANPKEKNIVLRGPSFKVYEGCVHAIIGESGSGKSVITSLLYGLTGNNAILEGGIVKLYGLEVQNFSLKDWEKTKLRGRIVSAVFQNPMSILDPTMKVGEQIIEGMLINKIVKNRKEGKQEAIKYLELTKINNPEKVMGAYPHELSGGMIQRIALAAIVSLKPKLLIMDEPTTALDPTVQALVLDIIRELQSKFKISTIFISHDLGVVASIADYINIMYAGQIIEAGTKEEILGHPMHPYTWGLIMSMPDFNTSEKLRVIHGAVPSSLNNIVGDAFAVRNEYALEIDFEQEPSIYQISPTHFVKSSLLSEYAPKVEPPKIIQNLWNKFDAHIEKLYGKNIYVEDKLFDYYKVKSDEHNIQTEKLIEEACIREEKRKLEAEEEAKLKAEFEAKKAAKKHKKDEEKADNGKTI